MRLFSEAKLLKMETSCTKLREDIEEAPTFWQTYKYPTLSLMPNQIYSWRDYLRVAAVSALALTLFICVIQCFVLAACAIILRQILPEILDPKNHAHQIGLLSQEGFYQLPLVPIIFFLFHLILDWPRYFFWNRRAKRLQREGPVQVALAAAAVVAEDKTVWPPTPTGRA